MRELELIDTFEKYLRGELHGSDLEAFQLLLKENQMVAEKFEQHKEFRVKLDAFGRRKKVQAVMKDAQAEIDQSTKARAERSSRMYYYLAAACALAVVITVSFYLGGVYSNSNKELYSFHALKKQVQHLEAKQNAMMREQASDKTVVEASYSGTGFMISQKGYVLTNYHLVEDAGSVQIYNETYGALNAEVVEINKTNDLALLKVSMPQKASLSSVPFSLRKKEAEPGEQVFTIGYPREDMVYGEGSVSSSSGFRGDSTEYQISIPVNPGNSGGPLLDNEGNIAGIIIGKQAEAEGTGFAIKAAYIKEFIKPYMEQKEIRFTGNSISSFNRKDKVKKLKPFVFVVKVYQK